MNNLGDLLNAARARYVARNSASKVKHEEACRAMPGGNTRSVLYHSPFPLTMVRGDGAYLWDADGHRHIDFLGDFTSGLYGHSNPIIINAIQEALKDGLSLSGHNLLEARLAEMIVDRFPGIELVRFTNSGTEANLMAISAARIFTKRAKVMVFHGGYHGGVASFVGPNPLNVPFEFLLAPYNDVEATLKLVRENADDLAAILLEPMQGAGGCIPAQVEFLAALRQAADETGAILIFDEVMTSRLSIGGRQKIVGVTPDMTTLGKYLGGGMSFGAFGGRADIMAMFDPRKEQHIGHSGTFNNNILSMAAGCAGLSQVLDELTLTALNDRGEKLRERMNETCVQNDIPLRFSGVGSLFAAHATLQPVRSVFDLMQEDAEEKELFYLHLLERGIYIARRGFFALMLPIDDGHCDELVAAVADYATARIDAASD